MALPVLFEEINAHHGYRIGIATLAAEKTLNAISLEMSGLLGAQLRQWQADPSIAVVLLQGQGDKAFCAGGDLLQLYRSMAAHHASAQRDDVLANRYVYDFFACEYRLNYLIHNYTKPIISWGNGYVMGGGLGLATGASHRVVTEHSRLAMPEIIIGLYPDVGGSKFLGDMPDKFGRFLALTGSSIGAQDAIATGVADIAMTHASRKNVIEALIDQHWDGNDHDRVTDILMHFARQSEQAIAAGTTHLQMHRDAIVAACAGDTVQDNVAGILTMTSDDPWIRKAQQQLAAGSPGSICLSYALQQRAREMSLADVFRMEFSVSLRCAQRDDFAEGIRALLVDKDKQPKWTHAHIDAVTQEWLEGFFQSPWPACEHPLHILE